MFRLLLLPCIIALVDSQSCNEGMYPIYNNAGEFIQCNQCNSPCLDCANEVNGRCTDCQTAYYLFKYTYDSDQDSYCLHQTCDSGKYYDGTKCVICHAACESCFGPGREKCFTCKSKFFVSDKNTCSNCASPCGNCIKSASKCQSCISNTYFLSVTDSTLNAGQCKICSSANCNTCSNGGVDICLNCKPKFYFTQTNSTTYTGTCLPCTNPCKTCTQETTTSCLTCLDNFYFFLIETSTGQCKSCVPPCLTCIGNSFDQCKSCVGVNHFLRVVSPTADIGQCMTCDPPCKTCLNGGMNICFTCDATLGIDMYLLITNDTTKTGTCQLCSAHNCSECKDSKETICKKCNQVSLFLSMTNNASKTGNCIQCTTNFPYDCMSCQSSENQDICSACDNSNNYYLAVTSKNTNTGKCVQCFSQNCSTCKDGGTHICLTCISIRFLQITNESIKTGQCNNCPIQCNNSCVQGGKYICKSCSDKYYFINQDDQDRGECKACYSDCAKCIQSSNIDLCTACGSNRFLAIKDQIKRTGTCQECPTGCYPCGNGGKDICKDCINKYFFTKTDMTPYNTQTGVCQQCHYTCAQCTSQLFDACTSCNNNVKRFQSETTCVCGPFFMDDELDNQACVVLQCKWGSGQSINNDTGYCEVICGDGLVGSGQQCDDGNLISEDGCTGDCKVQDYFICDGSTTQISECMFTQKIDVIVSSIDKDPLKNKFTITLTMNMSIQIMNRWRFLQVVDFGFEIDNIEHQYSNGVVVFLVEYSKNPELTGKMFQLSFDLSKASRLKTLIEPYSIPYLFSSNNNLAMNAYPESVYNKISDFTKFVKAVTFACLGVFALGLIRGKIIALQLTHVSQITYFGLVLISQGDPLFHSMKDLIYSNGYNLNIFNMRYTSLPYSYSSIGIYQQLIQNINVMLCLPILLMLVSLILYIAAKLSTKSSIRKSLHQYKKTLVGEWVFISMIFSCTQVSFSLGAMIRYFINSGIVTFMSFIAAGVFLVFLCLILVCYKLRDHEYFGEIKTFFRETEYCQFYFAVHVIQRCVIGGILGAAGDSFISGAVIIAILITHTVLVGVYQPYSLKQQNLRSMGMMITSITIVSLYVSISIIGSSSVGEGFTVYGPYGVISILALSCLTSLIFISRQIKRFIFINFQQCFITYENQQKPSQVREQQDFDVQFRRRMQLCGNKQPLTALSRLARPNKKKKKLRSLQISIPQQLDLEISGDRLLERIVNFNKYQQQWLQKQNGGEGEHKSITIDQKVQKQIEETQKKEM